MREIRLTTVIAAPPERVFDLARSVDAHVASTAATRERAVGGRTSGLCELGDEVTWEAVHLGFRQRLTSRITVLDRPRFFRDRMIRGPFAEFEHDHTFEPMADGGTTMTDVLRFAAPFGVLGWLAERLVLERHLRHFLAERNDALRRLAESPDAWRPFLSR